MWRKTIQLLVDDSKSYIVLAQFTWIIIGKFGGIIREYFSKEKFGGIIGSCLHILPGERFGNSIAVYYDTSDNIAKWTIKWTVIAISQQGLSVVVYCDSPTIAGLLLGYCLAAPQSTPISILINLLWLEQVWWLNGGHYIHPSTS